MINRLASAVRMTYRFLLQMLFLIFLTLGKLSIPILFPFVLIWHMISFDVKKFEEKPYMTDWRDWQY